MNQKIFQSPELTVISMELADLIRTSAGNNELEELDQISL